MAKEQRLVDLAREVVTDEDVLGAGVFVPAGTAGMDEMAVGADVATMLVSRGAMPGVGGLGVFSPYAQGGIQGVPPFTLIAVTATKIYLIGVHTPALAQWISFSDPQLYKVLDRSTTVVGVHALHLALVNLTLNDLENQHEYHFQGSGSKHSGGHQDVVIALLDTEDGGPGTGSG